MLENFQWFLVLPELLILADVQRPWRNLKIFLDYASEQENKGRSGKMIMLYYKMSEAVGNMRALLMLLYLIHLFLKWYDYRCCI